MLYKHTVNEPERQVVAELFGDIDIYNAQELKEGITCEKGFDLVIDCKELNYIDSTGLGVLVGILKNVRADGGDVFVKNLKPHLYKIFELTALDKLFNIEVAK